MVLWELKRDAATSRVSMIDGTALEHYVIKLYDRFAFFAPPNPEVQGDSSFGPETCLKRAKLTQTKQTYRLPG